MVYYLYDRDSNKSMWRILSVPEKKAGIKNIVALQCHGNKRLGPGYQIGVKKKKWNPHEPQYRPKNYKMDKIIHPICKKK